MEQIPGIYDFDHDPDALGASSNMTIRWITRPVAQPSGIESVSQEPHQSKWLGPKATPSSEEWEDYKPILEQLYLVEDMKLKDVMEVMSSKFDFRPTIKMYKTKITVWGFKKNYTAAEKQQLAYTIKTHRDKGASVPGLTLGNRPAKLNRVYSYCRRQKVFEEILSETRGGSKTERDTADALPVRQWKNVSILPDGKTPYTFSEYGDPKSVRVKPSTSEKLDLMKPLSMKSDVSRVELILIQSRTYLEWRFMESTDAGSPVTISESGSSALVPASPSMETPLDTISLYKKLTYGVRMLARQKPAQGWLLIEEGCELFRHVLDNQYRGLLRLLLGTFNNEDWLPFPDLKLRVLRFMTKYAVNKLGCKHPLSISLFHLQDPQVFLGALDPAFELLMAVYSEHLEASGSEVWRLKRDYHRSLRERNQYYAAVDRGMSFLQQFERDYGRLHWRTRGFLYEMASTHFDQHLYPLAIQEFEDVLDRGRGGLKLDFPDRTCVTSFKGLAICYEKLGKSEACYQNWKHVVTWSIIVWGWHHEETKYFLSYAESSLLNLGISIDEWLEKEGLAL